MFDRNLISLIVPFFRTPRESFLSCIISLLKQTYRNIEILVIDDASGPEYCAVLEEIQKMDPRIRVEHQPINQGLSAVRNLGLKICSGDDVIFIDSDDMLHHTAVQSLFEAREKTGADLVIGGLCITNTYNLETQAAGKKDNYYVYTTEQALERMITNSGFGSTACGRLARKNIWLKEETGPFIEGLLHEDLASIWEVVERCQKICWIDRDIYYYYQGDASAIHSKEVSEKFCRDFIFALQNRNQGILKRNTGLKIAVDFSYLIICPNIYVYADAIVERTISDEIKSEVKELFDKSYNSGMQYKLMGQKQKLKVILFKHMPNLYCGLYRLLRRSKGLRN